jgi:hypothetical protein
MSPNYSDIGFAVATGDLTGSETVLVVEMFGTQANADDQQIADASASDSGNPITVVQEEVPQQPIQIAQANAASEVSKNPLIDSQTIPQRFGIILLGLLIGVLILDALIIERKKIVRLVAHNTDHIAFLLMILVAIIIIQQGHIL